jgi:hypothetical protein
VAALGAAFGPAALSRDGRLGVARRFGFAARRGRFDVFRLAAVFRFGAALRRDLAAVRRTVFFRAFGVARLAGFFCFFALLLRLTILPFPLPLRPDGTCPHAAYGAASISVTMRE